MLTGELDPERIGSGIQFGDSKARLLRQDKTRKQADCFCSV